jgi:hypothetical protein
MENHLIPAFHDYRLNYKAIGCPFFGKKSKKIEDMIST